MTREKVFALINKERAYQDAKYGFAYDKENTIDDWVEYIWRFLVNATKLEGQYDRASEQYKMIQIRKIAALAVVAMEYNDTPDREL